MDFPRPQGLRKGAWKVLLEVVIERSGLGLTWELGPGNEAMIGGSSPSPVLEWVFCPTFPHWMLISGTQPWESNMLIPFGWDINWTPLTPLINLRFWQVTMEIYYLTEPNTSLEWSKLLCLSNLPPTIWSPFLPVSPCPLCMKPVFKTTGTDPVS